MRLLRHRDRRFASYFVLGGEGMWEVRGDKQHFVYSKVMMWVCLDRGVRLADKYSKSALNKAKWQRSRDQLYEVRSLV